MQEQDRYSMPVDNIRQNEIDLLECLLRIDLREAQDPRAGAMCSRLVEAGLVDDTERGLRLTMAGIERSQSLQHRLASDREAAKVLAARGIALALLPPLDVDSA
ncbi:MAG TPA: hypothetical protein VN205_11580 [Thermomonas sp.]|nr:hypothetical protein [Thermomonas sp.]